jgi:uncharacterized repeat protein (TIGR03803 family)
MQSKKSYSTAKMVFAIFVTFLLASIVLPAQAQAKTKFKVLHTFKGAPNDGYGPEDALILDSAGNLYGTGSGGGNGKGACARYGGCGTAFKMEKNGKRVWQHSFHFAQGFGPVRGLLRGQAGNLYGTTIEGGDTTCEQNSLGCGTVFKLDPMGQETVLYKFKGLPDGAYPDAPVVEDAAGNLYGTTENGGTSDFGTVFKVDRKGNETVLHSFTAGSDGCLPAGVILDSAGNLYGVAEEGGGGSACDEGGGLVFKLDTAGGFTVLRTFGGSYGVAPDSVLLLDTDGNLYGTTGYGGNSECGGRGCGVVFEVSPDGAETVLYTFCSLSNCVDGATPGGGPLVRDGEGNLYGTTDDGGAYRDGCNEGSCGVVFKLNADGDETVLHSFTGGTDGGIPVAGLVMDTSGNLYGTALQGGDLNCKFNEEPGCGVVYKIAP